MEECSIVELNDLDGRRASYSRPGQEPAYAALVPCSGTANRLRPVAFEDLGDSRQ